jgi:hypothetical protein
MDNVGIVVESLDAAISFFAELGASIRSTIPRICIGRIQRVCTATR